jgi:hypothetical protein
MERALVCQQPWGPSTPHQCQREPLTTGHQAPCVHEALYLITDCSNEDRQDRPPTTSLHHQGPGCGLSILRPVQRHTPHHQATTLQTVSHILLHCTAFAQERQAFRKEIKDYTTDLRRLLDVHAAPAARFMVQTGLLLQFRQFWVDPEEEE